MLQFTHCQLQRLRSIIATVFVTFCLLGITIPFAAQARTPNASKPQNIGSNQEITTAEIAKIFGAAQPFDPNRTVAHLSQCKNWQEPISTDPAANRWYRAATTLHAIGYRNSKEHLQMLLLYEAAARKGHYLAMKNLIIIYSDDQITSAGRYLAEPQKARIWLIHGLKKGWPGALEWLSTALSDGSAGYKSNDRLSLNYLQQASDLGVALAQYQLSKQYGNALRQMDKEEALLQCAANQGLHAALYDLGIVFKIDGKPQEALSSYHHAVMAGGVPGAQAANVLYTAFGGMEHEQRRLNVSTDLEREKAYWDLYAALSPIKDGTPFLRFPKLNEVLPLPPAAMPPWKGIYSAMSEDDAKYYKNPPSPDVYLEEVRQQGFLLGAEFLSKPVPIK